MVGASKAARKGTFYLISFPVFGTHQCWWLLVFPVCYSGSAHPEGCCMGNRLGKAQFQAGVWSPLGTQGLLRTGHLVPGTRSDGKQAFHLLIYFSVYVFIFKSESLSNNG